ncbi:MAG TPA: hypothetical protein VFB22_10420 [Candidatus Baltobacteraceae bacterium]|nr:hypothetical protein [Candidatus Baltobacteraceae bacterium]
MLTALNLQRHVACAAPQGPLHLESWFAQQARDGHILITLRAPVGFAGWPKIELARECLVQITPARPPGSMIPEYRVTWNSANGGPFPEFTGILSIRNADDYTSCNIALDGTYRPPLGPTGVAFDRTIGHTIAVACGNDLLERIATWMESEYRAVEQAKSEKRASAPH